MTDVTVRPATVHDVPAIQALVRPLALEGILLDKEAVAYYEAIQEFLIVEDAAGQILGCGALHVMWQNIAEIRTLWQLLLRAVGEWGTPWWPPWWSGPGIWALPVFFA